MRTNAANAPSLGQTLKRFAADSSGATAIEYGIIAAGVGAFIAGTVYNLGSVLEETLYGKILNAIQ